jgi:hypothetical protein
MDCALLVGYDHTMIWDPGSETRCAVCHQPTDDGVWIAERREVPLTVGD